MAPLPNLHVIDHPVVTAILPGFDLWDYWPVQDEDGNVARIGNGTLMMLLSAPVLPDPNDRHAFARIRLMHHNASGWRDMGALFADGFTPGSREWSGSAVLSRRPDRITLYFTAAGQRGECVPSFDQRLFQTTASIDLRDDLPGIGPWSMPIESVAADGIVYARDMTGGGNVGTIKAFRDPYWFRDPADGGDYLLFAASLAQSSSAWNGAIGIARHSTDHWLLDAPLITADGLNNELERPHILCHRGRYYCFWSAQEKVFASGGPSGPTGLYGMVAAHLAGPWQPLNGTGLVAANPPAAPMQAYSWLVLADLTVLSFIDRPGLASDTSDPATARRHFGGTPAPSFRLALDGERTSLLG